MVKTIIAGSRSITDYDLLLKVIDKIDWTITEVISGHARGPDQLGEKWALENNIPVTVFHPDWYKHGRGAGYVRNAKMAEDAEALIALWDGESRGTKHMITTAHHHRLQVYVHKIEKEDG